MKDQCYQFVHNQVGKPNIIGFGSYGQVKVAKNLDNNNIVAIKLIHGKNAKEQIDVHHKLNHPNIIKLLNYYFQKQKNITYLVLQYAENGSLNQKIKFGLGLLDKDLVKRYFKDTCEAIKYLHSHNYMHRDLKPQNILITKQNMAKLCDFGFTAIFQARTTVCGTFQYMAPEMIKKRSYNYKIDIWALGILLFQMIQGTAPFKGEKAEQVLNQMRKPIKFSSRFQTLEIDLIKKILRVNPDNRPNVDQILEHPYFNTLNFKQLKQQPRRKTGLSFLQNKNSFKKNSPPYLLNTKLNTSSKQDLLFLQNSRQQQRERSKSRNDKVQVRQRSFLKYNKYIKTQPNTGYKKEFIQENKIFFNNIKNKSKIQSQNQETDSYENNKKQSNTVSISIPSNQKKESFFTNKKQKNREIVNFSMNLLEKKKDIKTSIIEKNDSNLIQLKSKTDQKQGFKINIINKSFKKFNLHSNNNTNTIQSSINQNMNQNIKSNNSFIGKSTINNNTKQYSNKNVKNIPHYEFKLIQNATNQINNAPWKSIH